MMKVTSLSLVLSCCVSMMFVTVASFSLIETHHCRSMSSTELQMANENNKGLFGGISNFFEELDAFVDDATSRRLGNGAAFYGKRKSGFYGEDDKGKKLDKNRPDPTGEKLEIQIKKKI